MNDEIDDILNEIINRQLKLSTYDIATYCEFLISKEISVNTIEHIVNKYFHGTMKNDTTKWYNTNIWHNNGKCMKKANKIAINIIERISDKTQNKT